MVAVANWGESFCNKKFCLHCDNLGVVDVVNSLSGFSPSRGKEYIGSRSLSFTVGQVPGVGALSTSAVADCSRVVSILIQSSLSESTWFSYNKAWHEWGAYSAGKGGDGQL